MTEKAFVPLYRKIYLDLKKKIQDQVYPSGQKLPYERELCDLYGVKRVTTVTYEDPVNGDAMTGMSTSTSVSWEDKTATILLQYAEIDDAGNVIGL